MKDLILLEINLKVLSNQKSKNQNITEEDRFQIEIMQDKLRQGISQSSDLYCSMSVFIIDKHF